MPPTLALFVWLILLLALLRFDPANVQGTSSALWVPVIWMFIIGSRLPSQWLGNQGGIVPDALEEGNPLDRTVWLFLILVAIGVMMSRSFNWNSFVSRNLALTAFVLFSLVSVCWSDYAFISFKRWFRDLGNYLVIVVVLSDPRPMEAIRVVLRRVSYLLVPLSILLIKYYPNMSKGYDAWTGKSDYLGATTSKNMLGVVCVISGLYFFWDTVTRWSDRRKRGQRRIILVNVVFIAMTLWLLNLAASATSRVCLALGCAVIAMAQSKTSRRHPNYLKWFIPTCLCLYLVLAFVFNINASLAGAVGRDPTLTDRTKIWALLLSMHTNPLIGTGYESFWLGPRLKWFWRTFPGLNEAHNGFLEVYLNMGLIGLSFLAGFLIASYRTFCRKVSTFSSIASLTLALWTIVLLYNVTEAAFKGQLLWLTFLMASIAVPRRAIGRVHNARFDTAGVTECPPRLPLETTDECR